MSELRARRADERGVTLTELLVVMSIMLVFGLLAFTSVTGVTDTAVETQSRSTAIDQSRRVLETIIRDLRAANPIKYRADVTEYENQISFDVYCEVDLARECPDSNQRLVSYRVADNTLYRSIAGSEGVLIGPASGGDAESRFAVLSSPGQPLFRYFDREGDRLRTRGALAADGTKFRDCTKTVQVDLRVRDRSDPGAEPLRLVTTVTIRNFNEVSNC